MKSRNILPILMIVCITYIQSFSQEVLTTKFLDEQASFKYLLPAKQVDGDAISVTCNYGNKWISFLINEDYSIGNEIVKVVEDAGMYDNYLGYINADKNYTLFFSNNRKNKFITLQLDHAQGTSKENIINLKIADERYVATYNFQNKFYFLTVTDGGSVVNTYEFTGSDANNYRKKTYDLSEVDFLGKYSSLHHNLISTEPDSRGISVSKITKDYPNSIPTNQVLRKIYFQDTIAYISLERSKRTLVLEFNLITGTFTNKIFEQPGLICNHGSFSSANSVIFEHYLYQVNVCSKELVLKITDMPTGKIVKQMHMEKGHVQDFTYTLFKQEIGESSFSRAKEREVAINDFLSKMANAQVSISVNAFTDSTLEVDIGKYEIRQSSIAVPTPFLAIGIITLYTDSYPSVIAAKSIFNKSNFAQIETDENNAYLKRNKIIEGKIIQRYINQFSIRKGKTYIVGNLDSKRKIFELVKYTKEDLEKTDEK